MSDIVAIKINMPDFTITAKKLQKIPKLVAATMQTQRGLIFDAEGAYNGRKRWAPLKTRIGQILTNTGTLRKSIGPNNNGIEPKTASGTILKFTGDLVTIGTNVAYASIHNEGLPKKNIPKRAFANLTSLDVAEITETVQNYINAIFKR